MLPATAANIALGVVPTLLACPARQGLNALPTRSSARCVAMMRRSLVTNGPRFSATRMLREYADRIYRSV